MFIKGKKKTGGRIKGQSSKAKLTVRELCDKKGVDVLSIILDNLKSGLLPPQVETKTALALMPYLFPTQRATEVSGTIEHTMQQPLVQITLPSNGREIRVAKSETLPSNGREVRPSVGAGEALKSIPAHDPLVIPPKS